MLCPKCSRLIICKSFNKHGTACCSVDIHCVCGYNWPGYSPTASKVTNEDTHEFYGDWNDTDINRVLRGIENYCDNDLRFFKGRKIVTTWQANYFKVLVFNDVNELISSIKTG